MSTATDGTQLNTGVGGDIISDEDMTGQPRGIAVPQLGSANAGYKLERTKVAVGSYGQDIGDADDNVPLAVRDRLMIAALETIVFELRALRTILEENLTR